MKIVFYNSDSIHPPSPYTDAKGKTQYRASHLTISEVANILETKYAIVAKFNDYINDKFLSYLKDKVFTQKEINLNIINEWIKDEWREWIIGNGTGIVTKASLDRGGQSFVDTGAYYENMYMQVIFNDKEKAILNQFFNIIDKKFLG